MRFAVTAVRTALVAPAIPRRLRMAELAVRKGTPELKDEDKPKPQVEVFDLDLDEEVISHLAIAESVHAFRAEKVKVTLIEDEEVADIYEWAMGHYKEHGKPATPTVLAEEFDISFAPPETAVFDLISRLRERYAVNNARGEMQKVADAYKADPLLVAPTMIKVGQELSRLLVPQGNAFGSGDLDRVIELYDKRALAGPGPSLGFEEIDEYTDGMRGVTICIASPKGKKSWFTTKSFYENILNGKRCYLYSLELPPEEMNERLYAMAGNIPPWKFIKRGLTIDDRKLLHGVQEVLDEQGSYKIVKPPIGERSIESMVERAVDDGADVVYIDQLQYVEYAPGHSLFSAKPQEYGEVLNMARDLSDDIPLWLVHQFNRSAMFADSMPEMQQAKGAAAVEETASLIMGLWANKDMHKSGVTEFGMVASRHFMNQSWEISVDMNRGCKFECIGIAEHDDDE
jgi:hypothetical protein